MDLFEHYETLPIEVQAILEKYCDGDNTYEECANLVAELETVGYTCEYGLDAEPYELRKLSKFDEWSREMVDKVFNAILDEMPFVDACYLKKEVRTHDERIRYFIKEEKRFENYFL